MSPECTCQGEICGTDDDARPVARTFECEGCRRRVPWCFARELIRDGAAPCVPCDGSGWLGGDDCVRCVGTGLDPLTIAPGAAPEVLPEYAVERIESALRLPLVRARRTDAADLARFLAREATSATRARLAMRLGPELGPRVADRMAEALREHARVVRYEAGRLRADGREHERIARACERVAERLEER